MHFIESAKADVNVEQVGVVKLLADMGKHNGGLYGIFSIDAALGAGFGSACYSKNAEVYANHIRVASDKSARVKHYKRVDTWRREYNVFLRLNRKKGSGVCPEPPL
jgi:hypothetical protein